MAMKKQLLVSSMLLAGVLSTSGAYALIIDTFDDATDTVTADSNPGPSTSSSSEAIGGFRTLEITSSVPPGGEGTTLSANGIGTPGRLAHSQDAGFDGSSQVLWNANGAGLGGADLTDGGLSDALLLDVISIDQGSVDLTFTIVDTSSNISTLSLSNLGVGTSTFSFNDFVGTASLTSVNSISLDIVAGTASDLVLDLVETNEFVPPPGVPTPGTLALLGLGLLGFGFLRRRQ